jgi:hypothetical protein
VVLSIEDSISALVVELVNSASMPVERDITLVMAKSRFRSCKIWRLHGSGYPPCDGFETLNVGRYMTAMAIRHKDVADPGMMKTIKLCASP